MALTTSGFVAASGATSPVTATLGTACAVGDVIVVCTLNGNAQVASNACTDNVNTGNYKQIAVNSNAASFQWTSIFWLVCNAAGTPVISVVSPGGTLFLEVFRISGFTGTIPSLDNALTATPTAAATTTISVTPITNSFANEVTVAHFFGGGTYGTAAGWTKHALSVALNLTAIQASPGTANPISITQASSAWTGSLVGIYDWPGTGDDLLSDGRDLLAYDNRWNYCTPATTDWIHVGATGAFCNLNSGGHAAHAFFAGSFTADQQAQCQFISTVDGARAGIAVRLSSGTIGPTGYYAWFDSAHYNVFVINNGTATSLIGGLQPRVTNVGDIFNLSVRGSTLTLTVNGTTLQQVTDTTVLSGNPGIAFDGIHPSTVIAFFRGGSLGTNLAGQTVNSTVGQISEIASYKPTAQTGSFTAGTLTDSLTLTLGTQTASFAEGSLFFVENITGQSATFTEGAITASTSGNITVNFGAQSSQIAQGQLFDNISYVLDQGATTAQLFSQTATFVQGNFAAEADYFPLAFTVTSAEGVATTGLADSLGALTLISSEGTISASFGSNINNTFSAQAIASSEGVINLEADYFPLAQTLAFTEGTITFSSTQDFTVTLSAEFGTFTTGLMIANVIVPTAPNVYPNVSGLILDEATQQLEIAGAIVPASIGYFGTWPITVRWVPSQVAPFVVLSQNPTPGVMIVPNQPITLTVSEPDKSVAYP